MSYKVGSTVGGCIGAEWSGASRNATPWTKLGVGEFGEFQPRQRTFAGQGNMSAKARAGFASQWLQLNKEGARLVAVRQGFQCCVNLSRRC